MLYKFNAIGKEYAKKRSAAIVKQGDSHSWGNPIKNKVS